VRILHVITMLELGGAQQNTLHTCRRLAERGHDVALAHGPGGLLDAEAAAGPFTDVVVPSLVRPVAPARDMRALVALVRLVRRRRPDVVHTHSGKAGALGRLAGRLGGARAVVHTVHGWSFSDHQPWLPRTAYRWVERALRPATDMLISVSRADLDNGLRMGLATSGRAAVIRSGFDIKSFTSHADDRDRVRSEWGVAPGQTLVVNASCLKPQKAPLDFVRAAAQALATEPSLRFALVGDGELRPDVEATAAQLGLGDAFRACGWRRDMPSVLHAADVVALTSLWEGLPRTVVQALVAGKPVVATRVNGTPEVVRHGLNGFLLEPHDIDGFARAFVDLARDPALRSRLGSAGVADIEQFDQERMVVEQEALYARVLARRDEPA
jgi:glycosyltransferase involved in cell wall biosynthesis